MTRKKKIRQSKQQQDLGKEETSDEDSPSQRSSNGCPHIAKAINGSNLKKAIKNNTIKFNECQSCGADQQPSQNTPAGSDVPEANLVEQDKPLWLCLQCGYQGCGRNSSSRHSLLHHQTPHSDPHNIMVNPDTWAIWCYKCDDEVGVDSNRRLTECVDLLKKHFSRCSKQPTQVPSKPVFPISKINLELQPAAKVATKTTEETPKPSPKKPINGLRPDTNNVMRVKGLSNLGNTCFFNAVLQTLSQCRCFVGVLQEHCSPDWKWHIVLLPEQRIKDKESVDVTLGSCGALTTSLLKFLDEMEQVSQKKNGVLSPAQLFKRVCEKASQFRGFQQQDSHELLRYLLDAVKTEEIKRQRLGLLQALGIEKTTHKDVDEKTRCALKSLSSVTDFTVVEKVFGGQLVSTVQCEECHVSSQVFETFMDLCLPIFEEKPSRPGLHKRSNSVEKEDSNDCGVYQKSDNSKPSRHQEKKAKRMQKREVKKQLKSQKLQATVVSLAQEPTNQETTEHTEQSATIRDSEAAEEADVQESEKDESLVSEDKGANSVISLFPDMDEADVEDNDETSSHHSQMSSKSQNESDISSLSPSETVCASGSTTVESDLTTTETIEDNTNQALEIGYLCNQVASLGLNHQSENRESFSVSSGTVAGGLTSPSSVEIISTDSGIVGSSTDSGISRTLEKITPSTNSGRMSQKCSQKMITTSLMPLAPPLKLASQECSLLSSLHQFTMKELLVGNNKFGCENCSRRKAERNGIKTDDKMPMVYTNASKQLLISSPPAVLTLQLKRFQQVGRNLMKVQRYVEFPVLLDLAPFCSRLALALPHVHSGQRQILYSLVGVVEHSGKLTDGF